MSTSALPWPTTVHAARLLTRFLTLVLIALFCLATMGAEPRVRFDPELTWPRGAMLEGFPEAAGKIRVTVARPTGDTNQTAFEVRYQLSATTNALPMEPARPGVDFEPAEGSLTFGPGDRERSFELVLLDDFEVDGGRAIQLQLTGIPGNAASRWFVAEFELRDSERSRLEQEVAVTPFVDPRNSTGAVDGVFPLPDGRTLVRAGLDWLRLGPDGLPDPEFGQGSGRAPLAGPGGWHRVIPLADGGFYWIGRRSEEGVPPLVVRVLRDGRPDPGFGDGGIVDLREFEPSNQLNLDTDIQLAPDGGLLVLFQDDPEMRQHVRRLGPDGRRDAGFQEWIHETPEVHGGIARMAVAPEGSIRMLMGSGALMRLRPDGQPETGFPRQVGSWVHPGLWQFDAEGRLYAQVNLPEVGPRLVRIQRTREVEPAFGPYEGFPILIKSDGSIIALSEDEADLVSHDGTVQRLFSKYWGQTHIGSPEAAMRFADGGVRILFKRCWGGGGLGGWFGGCSTTDVYLPRNGSPQFLEEGNYGRAFGARDAWGYQWMTDSPTYFHSSSIGRRYLPQSAEEVGFSQTMAIVTRKSGNVRVQRTGSTASEAIVRGRMMRRDHGQWDAASARPWEAHFGRGADEAEVNISGGLSDFGTSVDEYLLRMEDAVGLKLSALTGCQIWAINERLPSGPDSLAMTQLTIPEYGNATWLLVPQNVGRLEHSIDPAKNWESVSELIHVGDLGAHRVFVIRPSERQFFRTFRP